MLNSFFTPFPTPRKQRKMQSMKHKVIRTKYNSPLTEFQTEEENIVGHIQSIYDPTFLLLFILKNLMCMINQIVGIVCTWDFTLSVSIPFYGKIIGVEHKVIK